MLETESTGRSGRNGARVLANTYDPRSDDLVLVGAEGGYEDLA